MTHTAVAAEEPERQPFATGGIVSGGMQFPTTWGCDGYVISREAYEAMKTAATHVVHVDWSAPPVHIDLEALRRASAAAGWGDCGITVTVDRLLPPGAWERVKGEL